jgi:hypothetical protein
MAATVEPRGIALDELARRATLTGTSAPTGRPRPSGSGRETISQHELKRWLIRQGLAETRGMVLVPTKLGRELGAALG